MIVVMMILTSSHSARGEADPEKPGVIRGHSGHSGGGRAGIIILVLLFSTMIIITSIITIIIIITIAAEPSRRSSPERDESFIRGNISREIGCSIWLSRCPARMPRLARRCLFTA